MMTRKRAKFLTLSHAGGLERGVGMTTNDVLVVGGGLGGLLTAALLEARGREVLVLEGSSVPGGLARSPELGAQPMNLGAHALYLGGPADRALQSLGLKLEGFAPGAGFFLERGDEALVPMPGSVLGLMGANWLSWRERWQLANTLRGILGAPPKGTVGEWLARLASKNVREFVASLTRVSTYTNAPDVLLASRAWPQLRAVVSPTSKGVRYLDGGWATLVDQLISRVKVRFDARVKSVSGATVTLENGEVLSARDVVLAVPLPTAARLVDDASLRARAKAAVPVKAACLDVVLKSLPRPERRLVLTTDGLYFSVHSRPGVNTSVKLHVMEYLAPNDAQTSEQRRARLEGLMSRVQPGWRDSSEGARFFPNLTVMEDVPREEVVRLQAPLHLVTGVASTGFLFDAVAESAMHVAEALTMKQRAAR